MKYLLGEIHWEYDDNVYVMDGFSGFGGIFATREEAERVKRGLERAAYRSWLSSLLRLDTQNKTGDPNTIYRFFVERLGADLSFFFSNSSGILPEVVDLPEEPAPEDLDELKRIVGAEFIFIEEIPDADAKIFRVQVNPEGPWSTAVNHSLKWNAGNIRFFLEPEEGILSMYRNTLFAISGDLRLEGSIKELSVDPQRLNSLIETSDYVQFEGNNLVLSSGMSEEEIILLNSLFCHPPILVEELEMTSEPEIQSFDINPEP